MNATGRQGADFFGRSYLGNSLRPAISSNPGKVKAVPAAVVAFVDLNPWDCFIQFAAGLRMRGVRVCRITSLASTRSRRFNNRVQNWVYHGTHAVLPGDPDKFGQIAAAALPSGLSAIEAIDGVAAAMMGRPGVPLRTSDEAHEHLLWDKLAMNAFCEGLGLAVARTVPVEERHQLARPFLVKPRRGAGGIGVVRITDADDAAVVSELDRENPGGLLAQEELAGELIHVGGVARQGEVVQAAAYADPHRTSDYYGASTSIVTLHEPEILHSTAELVRGLGLTGAFCLDFIRVADGRAMLIDVNARVFGSWLPLQLAGLDLIGAYMFAWGLTDAKPNGEVIPGVQARVMNAFSSPRQDLAAAWLNLQSAIRLRRVLGLRWAGATCVRIITGHVLFAWSRHFHAGGLPEPDAGRPGMPPRRAGVLPR